MLVPILLWLGSPVLTAIGLSQVIQVSVSLAATAGNFYNGNVDLGLGGHSPWECRLEFGWAPSLRTPCLAAAGATAGGIAALMTVSVLLFSGVTLQFLQ